MNLFKVLSVGVENGYLKWDNRNLGFGYRFTYCT